MLDESDSISSVSVEDSDGGAFDDVVVRRTVRPDIYIQAKSSNYGNEIVDSEWLLTSRRPNGKSPLQYFYKTYCDLVSRGGEFSLELWTNKGFDHMNPLLGGLHDRKHDKIAVDPVRAASPKSKIGAERDRWVTHLGITFSELAEFLAAVRWRHTDSELVIRERAKPFMKLAGLRSDDAAVHVGVSIVRGWVSDGAGPQSAADVARQVTDLGLLSEHRHEIPLSGPAVGVSQPASIELRGFPPGCRTCIESLLSVSHDDAFRIASELSRPTSRIPGVLAHLADNPPQWLLNANSLAWDAIVAFSEAHELPDSDGLRKRAVEQGSPLGPLYRVRAAVEAADGENLERARELLTLVPEEYPLFVVARARIDDGDRAVVDAIRGSSLIESQDPEIALFATLMLVVAYCRLDEVPQALALLKEGSQRFPERASLHLHRASLTLSSAVHRSDRAAGYSSLLSSAVTHALEARDRFREWGGPSGQTVAIAATALLLLNEHEQVCDLAAGAPNGDATREEARHPEVITCLAEALLVLNRREQLDELDVDLLDAPERAHLLALRAHRSDDPDAHRLMQTALEQATDDRSRLRAHHGLALFGELDESALEQLSTVADADKDLIRAMAYFHREDYATAAGLLRPHHRDSLLHAELLANVQVHSGAIADAIETLKTAGEVQGSASLYCGAVRLLVGEGELDEAEAAALTALGGDISLSSERELRCELVEIASRLGDCAEMESRARALFNKFPEVPLAPWAIVQALVGQVKVRSAWDFLVENDLSPIDEQTAQLAIQVCGGTDATDGVAERLLEIATNFVEVRDIVGAALATLMAKADQISLTGTQHSLLASMVNSYVERFPESEILRAFHVDGVEELQEFVESVERSRAVQISEIANQVRNGYAPYGVLVAIRGNPYAELLLSLAADYLTAISLDEARRESERRTARGAIAGDISVDTSVAVVGIRSGLPVEGLTSLFNRVLVADALLHDARATVIGASQSVDGHMGYSPAAGGFFFSQVTKQQRDQMRDESARLVEIIRGWHNVQTARLSSPFRIDDEHLGADLERLRIWDASLRVAAERQCPLWCDDAALRALAESVGIRTFGSFALWEVLTADGGMTDLPSTNEIKAKLLRSGIADVPLTGDELSQIVDAGGNSDLAAIRFLDRRFSWARPQLVLQWYKTRVEALSADPDHNRLLEAVRAACCGRGMAEEPSNREVAMGEVLAETLNAARLYAVDSAERVPGILAASRYACRQVDPSGQLDVLRQALATLYDSLSSRFGPMLAGAILRQLFAQAAEADRNTLAAVILSAH